MKTTKRKSSCPRTLNLALARALVVAGLLFCAADGLAQIAPVLTIAPTGTNQISIIITNGISTGNYEVWWTPVLGDTEDYPWMAAAVGTTGQTNFTLTMSVYPTGFFQAVQDTNSIPLWEAADPHNPGTGILNVWIDSPANGATLN